MMKLVKLEMHDITKHKLTHQVSQLLFQYEAGGIWNLLNLNTKLYIYKLKTTTHSPHGKINVSSTKKLPPGTIDVEAEIKDSQGTSFSTMSSCTVNKGLLTS